MSVLEQCPADGIGLSHTWGILGLNAEGVVMNKCARCGVVRTSLEENARADMAERESLDRQRAHLAMKKEEGKLNAAARRAEQDEEGLRENALRAEHLNAIIARRWKRGATDIATVAQRVATRGPLCSTGVMTRVGMLAAQAYRERHGCDPVRVEAHEPFLNRVLLVYVYDQDDFDLIDTAHDCALRQIEMPSFVPETPPPPPRPLNKKRRR
jgi:hypothetical protein